MSKHYEVEFKVTGRGRFPFDMLRYERAWPKDGPSAEAMDYMPGFDQGKDRVVTLIATTRNSHWLPTQDRWHSFGWSVVEASVKGAFS